MRISVLSNVNLDMLSGLLKKENEVFQPDGYGKWVTYALKPEEKLVGFSPECLILLLEGNALLEQCQESGEMLAELDRTKEYVQMLAKAFKGSYILVSTIDIRPETVRGKDTKDTALESSAHWDKLLWALTEECPNVHRLELRQLIEEYGRKFFYSSKFWYMGSIPYDMKALHILAGEVQRVLDKLKAVRKKVLVLDLDNTLWGGVIGEDGVEGITLDSAHEGAVYRDAQREIKRMQQQGVLLAIASKNNREDVQAVFRGNPHMVLKESDFAVICANWSPKHENIKKMAKDLNLGLDAFVFVDDNEAERRAMEIYAPEVAVAEFPSDVSVLSDTMRRIYDQYFWNWRVTSEDRDKTRQYQEEKIRREEQSTSVSYEEYLKSLQTKIRLTEVKQELRDRAIQLMNKTNQFNVCTIRMDEPELERYLSEKGGHLLLAEVSDKHGNSGWVAEFLYHLDGKTVVVDNFLMSCRVMGRQIEHAIVGAVLEHFLEQGMESVMASYFWTAKNKPVEKLWEELGFTVLKETEQGKSYMRELSFGCPVDEGIHTVCWEESI